jgi:hypothetical protein
MGGKAVQKTMSQTMSHPIGRARQPWATGPSQPKMVWEYMRNRMPAAVVATRTMMARTRCHGLRRRKALSSVCNV